MTYIFNKESYSVERIVKLPKWENADFPEQCLEYYYKSPKSYPCLKDELWEDGKEYQEDEINIELCSCLRGKTMCFTSCGKEKVARLKPKEESQEEMLGEIIHFVRWDYDGSHVGFKRVLEYLQTKFTITRK